LAGALQLRRQMGCTQAEFMSLLPGATRQAPMRVEGDKVVILTGGGSVEITVEVMPVRRLGQIALPVLGVEFRFSGMDAAARRDFLEYFDLYTRRGGG
jgi:hypothetical protein